MRIFNATATICILSGAFVFAAVQPSPQQQIPKVKPFTIKTTETSETLMYPAQVEAAINATVIAEADGIIRQLPKLGSPVKKGQRVLFIQQLDPVYQYAPVKISAPVSGVISDVFVSEGARVSRGEKLAQVTDPKSLKVSIEVPVSDIHKIQKGIVGQFKSTLIDLPLEMSVEGISPSVSALTGTAPAILTFTKNPTNISAGLIGQVQIKIKPQSQILVPEQAIIYKGTTPYLRVIQNKVAKFREIALGSRIAGQVVITKGINVNEIIIERASQYVGDEKPVEIE